MPRSPEIQVLLGILHCTWQTCMGVTEGTEGKGRERRTFDPPPLHPRRAQATVLRAPAVTVSESAPCPAPSGPGWVKASCSC